MIYRNPGFLKQWLFEISINNINNYLKRDNGAHQYKWVAHPNVLNLECMMEIYPNSPLSTTRLITRLNGMKYKSNTLQNQPVGLETIKELNNR